MLAVGESERNELTRESGREQSGQQFKEIDTFSKRST